MCTYNKNKLYQTSDCWSRYILNFDFLKKGLGPVSPLHFVLDFSRKIFLISYYINWLDFLVWLPLLLQISANVCIVIVCYPVFDVINFEAYISFLIEPFSYMTKNSEQILKYLNNKKSFYGEIKIMFHHF